MLSSHTLYIAVVLYQGTQGCHEPPTPPQVCYSYNQVKLPNGHSCSPIALPTPAPISYSWQQRNMGQFAQSNSVSRNSVGRLDWEGLHNTAAPACFRLNAAREHACATDYPRIAVQQAQSSFIWKQKHPDDKH